MTAEQPLFTIEKRGPFKKVVVRPDLDVAETITALAEAHGIDAEEIKMIVGIGRVALMEGIHVLLELPNNPRVKRVTSIYVLLEQRLKQLGDKNGKISDVNAGRLLFGIAHELAQEQAAGDTRMYTKRHLYYAEKLQSTNPVFRPYY